ncbi:helix-turn-helix domain-containing protein [Parasutterella excrementihominis]|uniref:helix-turn-helix domain-containing protein n=1 Tax=Parasutterella excrementihominis TaxID=487175 RepID=UPI00248C485B|nr:helix-turn-helix domain-containing protein [Parasutterella excrementihominis]
MNSISERLKYALDLRGMSAAELARKLGVSKTSVSLWLSSTTKDLAATNALNAAKILEVDPYWLVFGTGGPETKLTPQEQNILGTIRKLDTESKELAEKLINKISA